MAVLQCDVHSRREAWRRPTVARCAMVSEPWLDRVFPQEGEVAVEADDAGPIDEKRVRDSDDPVEGHRWLRHLGTLR